MGALAVPLIDERARVLDLVDRRGVSPLSFLIRYDAGWRAHFCGDGAVCYLESPRAAVAWSDPLCADDDLPGVLGSFDAAMREQRRGVCLVAVSEQTARAAMAAGFSALKVGEEPWFDLATWERPRGDRGKKLRWLLNHAQQGGVEVSEQPASGEVEAIVEGWRSGLGRPESNSFMKTAPLELPMMKRLFVARREGSPEALLACAFLPANGAWYFEDLVRVPDALNGATELLVATALERLRDDGAPGAAFALAPMRGVRDQIDPRARWLGRVLEGVIRGLDRRYGFRAIARYEARFAPSDWRPRYVAFRPALPRPAVVRAAVRALA